MTQPNNVTAEVDARRGIVAARSRHPDHAAIRLETLMTAIYGVQKAAQDGGPDLQKRINAALASLEELGPRDEAEGMLAAQMVATHAAAMECLARAATPGIAPDVRARELKNALKFMMLYARQMETLDKHRGRGQQNVNVESLHIEPGAQAIVGNLNSACKTRRETFTDDRSSTGTFDNMGEADPCQNARDVTPRKRRDP